MNLFLDAGAELPAPDSRDAKGLAMFGADKGLERLFALCADAGVDLTMRNDNDGSLLHSASQGGAAGVVARLLDMGFDVNERDRYGRVPLHYAAEMGREDVARTLLDRGADIDARSLSGETPHNTARAVGREEMATFLAAAGASTERGASPYSRGSTWGSQRRVRAPSRPCLRPMLCPPTDSST